MEFKGLLPEKPRLEELLEESFFREVFDEAEGLPVFKSFVNGEWLGSAETRSIESPIDGSVIARFYVPGWEAVEKGLETVSVKGRYAARNTPGEKRLNILSRIAELMEQYFDVFVEALIVNSGKPLKAARGEVEASIDRLRKAALDLRRLAGDYIPGDWDAHTLESEGLVRREPYGVVLAIIPFNYPLFDTVNKFTYSFLPGNAFIVKPPSVDPVPVYLFAKVAVEAGVPRESFMLVGLPGSRMKRLVSDRRIHVISLTGSSETGLRVIRDAGIKQYIMELGGGDPAIVLEDADIDLAASKIATGITSYTGQRCDAIKIVLVEEPVYEELRDRLVEELESIRIGDPRREDVDIGPLIDDKAVEDFLQAVQDAVEKGGKLLLGGRRIEGRYVEPALIEVLDKEALLEMKAFRDEVFAPIALIAPVRDVDEAITVSNRRRYGLDAAVFGKDINKLRKLIRLLEVGAIYVNEYPRHGIGYYPFGGRKDSGIGREGIGYSIEQVTALKTIVYNYKGKGIWEYM